MSSPFTDPLEKMGIIVKARVAEIKEYEVSKGKESQLYLASLNRESDSLRWVWTSIYVIKQNAPVV